MNNNFLSESNFQYLINYVFNDIKQKIQYNITADKKYIGILKKLIQTIHTTNINKRVSTEYLNSLVIDKCVPFIINKINKENNSNQLEHIPQLNTSPRPLSTKINNNNNNDTNNMDFSNLKLEEDDNIYQKTNIVDNVMGLSSRNEPRVDFSSKMDQYENERNYSNSTNQNQNQNQNNMSLTDKITTQENLSLDQNIEVDNTDIMTRMKQLEESRDYNKLSQSSPSAPSAPSAPSVATQKLNSNISQSIENFSVEDDTFLNKLYQNQNDNQNQNQNDNLSNYNLNENYMSNENSNENNYDNYESDSVNKLVSNNVNNLKLNINDTSNQLENFDSNIEKLVENQNVKTNNENKDSIIDKTLLNTKYNFERRKKKVVTVDVSNDLPDLTNPDGSLRKIINNISGDYWNHFRVNLQEDLLLDKVTDVYLESIIINNPAQATNNSNLYICIDIDEFNIKTGSNNPYMFDKFVIPNENTSGPGTNKIMKYHLKSNYIATVNPTTLSSLTFKITNENNNNIYSNINNTSSTFINNTGGYESGTTDAIKINDGDGAKFYINDIIYDKNSKVIGIITSINQSPNPDTITILAGTQIKLYNKQEIFISNDRTGVIVNEANGVQIGATSITVDNIDATTIFSEGDNIYLGSGELIGKITAVAATEITIGDGTQVFLLDNVALYKNNPIAKVFSSNSKLNRLVLGLVFISR
jgi:hypothetical protein